MHEFPCLWTMCITVNPENARRSIHLVFNYLALHHICANLHRPVIQLHIHRYQHAGEAMFKILFRLIAEDVKINFRVMAQFLIWTFMQYKHIVVYTDEPPCVMKTLLNDSFVVMWTFHSERTI